MPFRQFAGTLTGLTIALSGCGPTSGLAQLGAQVSSLDDLHHNDLHHNSLQLEALQANQALRAALAVSPLDGATLRRFSAQLTDERTTDLLSYVVSCALAKDAPLPMADAMLVSGSEKWRGELGLCPDWATLPPSLRCQEIVSSCVISRVNARKKRVIISMRGQPSALFPLRAQVRVEDKLRSNDGTPIGSIRDACTGTGAGATEPPDCGWKALYVGRCTAGEAVTVCTGAHAGADGGSSSCGCDDPVSEGDKSAKLRVCRGLYGCDTGAFMSPDSDYAGPIADAKLACPQKRPAVTFTCPTNGPRIDGSTAGAVGPRYGYYSVMIAPADASARPLPEAVEHGVGAMSGDYPAREEDVFTYREGAFYGNLFSLAKGSKPLTVLSGDSYACYSDTWTVPLAYLTDRFCANEANCFDHVPMACSRDRGDRCSGSNGAPGEFYQDCLGPDGGSAWPLPITVYLNHPCDLGGCDNNDTIGNAPGFLPPLQ